MTFALVALASYGFWYVVGRSKISQALRDRLNRRLPVLVDLVECPGCFGFWTGLGVAVATAILGIPTPLRFLLPFIFVATNRILHAVASFSDVNDHATAVTAIVDNGAAPLDPSTFDLGS